MRVVHLAIFLFFAFLFWPFVSAEAKDSASITGVLGLNTIPNARMDPEGTLRTTFSRDGHYIHGSAGMQVSNGLYLGLRQSAENRSETDLFPGMDVKLRLFHEQYWRPEISVGLQSALGHRRMAAEYLALSKRYKEFDFTFGFGWGRMGTRQIIPNPLLLHTFSHDDRKLDGDRTNKPSDWFTGDAGLFGGVQYDMPIDGLSVKADWNSDKWKAERLGDPSRHVPAPWSIGLAYRPYDWFDAGVALQGKNIILARISLSSNLKDWKGRNASLPSPIDLRPREDRKNPLKSVWRRENSRYLGLDAISSNHLRTQARLDLNDRTSSAFQIGQGARQLSNLAGDRPEQIAFRLSRYGMKGPVVTINRRDMERAELDRQGSAEEIWRNTIFSSDLPAPMGRLSKQENNQYSFKLDWVTDLTLTKNNAGVIGRTALIPSFTKRIGRHLLIGTDMRINLADNFDHLVQYRPMSLYPVRADIQHFTRSRFTLDRQFLSGFVTLGDDLHAAASIGYLEEMYAGVNGEILYRPFAKPWAIGLEMSEAFKRAPETLSALWLNGSHITSGHISGYYEVSGTGATLKASLGRYLAGDVGGTLSLVNTFDNGVKIEGSVSATNKTDHDVFDSKTNLFTGVSLSLPLGNLPFIPEGSRAIINTKPLGRDMAQRLDNPVPLYDVTEPLSYRAITRHWSELIP